MGISPEIHGAQLTGPGATGFFLRGFLKDRQQAHEVADQPQLGRPLLRGPVVSFAPTPAVSQTDDVVRIQGK